MSFSIFEGEVNGIFSLPELGDIALVKTTSAEDEYMVFSDNDLTGTPDKFECLNQDNDTKLNKIRSQVEQHLEERAAGCISVDFEFDDEIYKDFGSNITTVTNWFTSLFNHIKTIYANEQIEITIKSLYIWTTADPYSSTVGTALDQVMASRQNDPSFTGNLHHLVLGYVSQSVGISGVAYVDVLCSRTYRFGTTRLYQYTTWSTFPSTYQWDIGSIAHEIGHNFGSHHTQWCGWTGGPIDNCYAVEGTCSPGPAPVNGGTIMSYCHLNTNYPMSNGFGPLPHTEIYNNFVAATCKSTSCSGIITPTPTCSDGIQNGDETGVDCGGSCVACGGGGGCTLGSNLSQGRITVSQSSTYSNSYPAPAANDGNLSTFNHTSIETSPWWQVDIGSVKTIGKIEVVNRVGCPGCVTQKRLEKFKIFVSNSPTPSNSDIVYTNSSIIGDGQTVSMNITPTPGRYVRIQCDFSAGANYLHIAELRAFECTSTPNICANNQSPTVSVQSNSASYPEKSNFTVSASANDPDGTISSVEFFNGSTSLGVITSAPYTLTINNASANPYSFKAKAIDNCGAITTSNTLVISTTNSCTDGFQNGAETGIDCGGSCVACGGGGGGCTLGSNLSQGRITVSQSSTYSNSYPAPAANDGNLSTFNHTSIETSPWWQVDIGSVKTIGKIEVVNRVGCPGCVTQKRLEKFKIFVSNSPTPSNSDIVYTNSSVIGDGQTVSMNITPTPGRYVRIQCDFSAGANYLHIAELRAFECTSTPNICANNQSPTVSVQSNSASYPEKSNFTVSASANDPDGTISSVEFFNGSTSLGVIASAPYTLTINSASAATYSFTAKALDNCGAITTSQILNISTTNSCTDGFQNGDETGIDCGGTCGPCNNSCTTLTKLSSNKPVTQISTYNNSSYYAGDKVLDGSNQTYNHTGPSTNPWLQIDLQNNFNISSIIINNRSGCLACSGRIKELKIFVSNTPTISNYSATPAFSGQIL
ncbi:MAG: discoidin domain-containing protein [Saprospiraceae bacterium]|nr:discoidin domain-containing protein [Saprospiraceae bacterium]